ncbi:unnamed protein product [Phytomonas sp. Hart1]|nr:unnamed protein product [Phytomonas sp. Hart1]|eukprot:CCW67319.1 unnamed protein product [Phytomonas sp. isolate Hart1]
MAAVVLPVFAPPRVRHLLGDLSLADDRLFDRVLVDTECSHDGSLAHIPLGDDARALEADRSGVNNAHRMQRMNLSEVKTLASCRQSEGLISGGDFSPPDLLPVVDDDACGGEDSLDPLQQLQLRLLLNGYDQLKVGGTLVYSTCSFSYNQNEFIIRKFLQIVNAHHIRSDQESKVDVVQTQPKVIEQSIAVVVPAFSYAHEEKTFSDSSKCTFKERTTEEVRRRQLAPCMKFSSNIETYSDTASCSDVVCKDVNDKGDLQPLYQLQKRLDGCNDAYGLVSRCTPAGERILGSHLLMPHELCHCVREAEATTEPSSSVSCSNYSLGSRFWPHEFQTSFQFVAKIWKKHCNENRPRSLHTDRFC